MLISGVLFVIAVIDGEAAPPCPDHGTAVCDSGLAKHRNGGCVVKQPTDATKEGICKEMHKDRYSMVCMHIYNASRRSTL